MRSQNTVHKNGKNKILRTKTEKQNVKVLRRKQKYSLFVITKPGKQNMKVIPHKFFAFSSSNFRRHNFSLLLNLFERGDLGSI
jgi:hypothetical protein